MPKSPQDIYARHLLSPRGYPLWTPEPSQQLLAYRRDGLRIGDVGVVIPEDGCFDVFSTFAYHRIILSIELRAFQTVSSLSN
ncbi:hypothetical protein JVT61DRAFT_2754 [Boletus reticuloceps]|uniref:Uncharacterized protein n=1 Tax=Boletus reticuloceps TaxID=495285 RepID=A0A8I2YR41_9AGAM|nr:hypothetical protein JVT61DRAFT_2754 [Boletus reticuloceps]